MANNQQNIKNWVTKTEPSHVFAMLFAKCETSETSKTLPPTLYCTLYLPSI